MNAFGRQYDRNLDRLTEIEMVFHIIVLGDLQVQFGGSLIALLISMIKAYKLLETNNVLCAGFFFF